MIQPRCLTADLTPWIEARFTRSPGPGGQNVNKVSTQVTLLFDFEHCTELSHDQRSRIRRKLYTRLSRDGRLRIISRKERSQLRNRKSAMLRLIELLEDALRIAKTRRPTRPTRSSKRKRLEQKRKRSQRKSDRRLPHDND